MSDWTPVDRTSLALVATSVGLVYSAAHRVRFDAVGGALHELARIPLVDLLLDTKNARLFDEPATQQAVYTSLAKQQGKRLIKLAQDIAAHGMDPTNCMASPDA